MDKSSIQRLRRFALAIGLILLTYSIAEVQIDTPAKINPLGIPLIINNPDLFGIAFLIASLYASLRYLYYAVLIGPSPRTVRKRLRAGKMPDMRSYQKDINLFFRDFSLEFNKGFPKVGKYEASYESLSMSYIEGLNVPWPVKFFCLLEDIDYYSPIWVNVFAILLYFIY